MFLIRLGGYFAQERQPNVIGWGQESCATTWPIGEVPTAKARDERLKRLHPHYPNAVAYDREVPAQMSVFGGTTS